VIDQQAIVVPQASLAVYANTSWGQSFTVNQPGLLTRIDFQLGRNAGTTQPLQVELRTANGDLPNLASSALLFSGSIAASNVPVANFITNSLPTSIDLSSAPPTVTPGQKLVILLSSSDADWYRWMNSGYFYSNPYVRGTSIKSNSTTAATWVIETNWDFGFRTWVKQGAVSTLAATNGAAIVTWNSVAGQTYRLQYKTNLAAPSWTSVLPDLTATGPITVATNNVSGDPQRFYRLIVP
jgi:hypothetical protein